MVEKEEHFYFVPKTLEAAIHLLYKYAGKAKILAGGTDLVVQMKKGPLPFCLINIKEIKKLHFIKQEKKGVWIGPLVSHAEIEDSGFISRELDFLSSACAQIGSVQIRNRGTIGGNLCNASPAADTAPPLLAANATLTIRGKKGSRSVSIDDFFEGPSKTSLRSQEILTGIFIPKMAENSAGIYMKQTLRKAVDIAKVGVAVLVTRDRENGLCKDCRIALGAVGPIPFRAENSEQIVMGTDLNENIIGKAAESASLAARPITDLRSSLEYRKELVSVLTRRSLKAAWEKAK